MHARKVILVVLLVVALLVLGRMYHLKYGRHAEFMKGFWGTTSQNAKPGQPDGGNRTGVLETLTWRYVDRPKTELTAFMNVPEYRDAPVELRRMKLLEFFTLRVADVDYMLLPDADKKWILDQFLEKYLVE
ncbi:MAG: hypothetical protein ACOY4F_01200 [Thermodesulfobacteriota bacterium]|nr:hypothetical protein [Desulfovibrio sp.]